MDDATERWLPVPGYEGYYEVSDRGRVRSLDRRERITGPKAGFRRRRGQMMQLSTMPSTGYLCVHLSRDDKMVTRSVHSLVLEAFDRPCPDGMECLHGPGGQQDNRWPENIRWGTRSENTLDQVTQGTHHHSRKTKCPRGHDYDYVVPGTNHRQCKRCRRINDALRAGMSPA
jgi:hypothetical protein